jgi:capsular polysaccharide biosynthesis protein
MLRERLSASAVPVIGAAAGVLAAGVVTLLQDSAYRADASLVLVRQGQPPGSDPRLAAAARAAAELFDTRAVAASAIASLGLDASPDELVERLAVHSDPDSSLVRIEVEAESRDRARRIAQEVAEVSSVLFNGRFGPQTVASVWDAAGARADPVSPNPVRNLALGALVGAVAGWIPLLLGKRQPRVRQPAVKGARRREQHVAPPPAVAAAGAPAGVPAPAPASAAGPFVLPPFGAWTIADVERLVAEQGGALPEQREEIELYLDTFRSVAGPDGRLPGDVDLVLEDVFADLIARSGSVRRG